jgi:hypothetical protein
MPDEPAQPFRDDVPGSISRILGIPTVQTSSWEAEWRDQSSMPRVRAQMRGKQMFLLIDDDIDRFGQLTDMCFNSSIWVQAHNTPSRSSREPCPPGDLVAPVRPASTDTAETTAMLEPRPRREGAAISAADNLAKIKARTTGAG